eukprot:TRINITY_DN7667_c0_g1_i1.p1 TRINITY_DN7667_c0_g1~~TRINITY_DN7667_c0_g1_i1.p1  ORF type:complete len:117 (-),score=17.34 TRINITY_DN7667_c0_g1_i1:63-413(-)
MKSVLCLLIISLLLTLSMAQSDCTDSILACESELTTCVDRVVQESGPEFACSCYGPFYACAIGVDTCGNEKRGLYIRNCLNYSASNTEFCDIVCNEADIFTPLVALVSLVVLMLLH